MLIEEVSDNIPDIFHPIIGDRVYLGDVESPQREKDKGFHFFNTYDDLQYIPFCDDFGPYNLASTLRFTEMLEAKLAEYPNQAIVYCVQPNTRNLTNAVYLLGSYMILRIGLNPEDVWSCFSPIASWLTTFRDATFSEQDFGLALQDCWCGLARAKQLGWIASCDLEEYEHYDNPLEGDLHAIVPDKLIAFRGPCTLPNPLLYEDINGCRHFSPQFYLEPFQDMGVTTVVRLNERQYDCGAFTSHDFALMDLEFEDCTSPPPNVVEKFLRAVRSTKGAVAVHCKAGLGRTGTLIAILEMLDYGFSAREAIAWTRIVRPGSIIGEQQHFLCALERFRLPSPQYCRVLVCAPPSPEAEDNVKTQITAHVSSALQPCHISLASSALVTAAALAAAARNANSNRRSQSGDHRSEAQQVASALHCPHRTALKLGLSPPAAEVHRRVGVDTAAADG